MIPGPGRHHRGQRGASLMIVLALVAFLAIMVPAILGLVMLGPKITGPVQDDRRELYAASSAIDAAVELGRVNPDVGVPGGPCPTQRISIDSLQVAVQCQQHPYPEDGCLYLDRFVNYTAEVRRSGDDAVLARAAAEVVYRFDLYGPPEVEIRQWTPNATGPVTTAPLPPCAPGATTTTTSTLVPTTSTTTTSTTTSTTTTSTTVPTGDSRTRWTGTATSTSGSDWKAEAAIDVTSSTGGPIEGASVRVRPEYLPTGSSTWVAVADITGTTTAAGSSTFHSPPHRRTGSGRVVQVRFTVLSVTTPQALAWNSAASGPITVVVNAP